MNNLDQHISEFWRSAAFAVVGASADRNKYGNKVLRSYIQKNRIVYPVNHNADLIEGLVCYKNINLLPIEVVSISIVTPPKITATVVSAAVTRGIKNIWIQPGAESDLAISICKDNNINIIYGGPCILVVSGFQDI